MPPNSRRAWRVILLASLGVAVTACTSLRVLPGRVSEPLPVRRTDEIRLVLRTGRTISLKEAQIVGDSVVGLNPRAKTLAEQRYAVHTADVVEVAVRRSDAFKTVLAVALGLVALTTVAVMAVFVALFHPIA